MFWNAGPNGEGPVLFVQGRIDRRNIVGKRLAVGQGLELGEQLAGLPGMAVSGEGVRLVVQPIASVVGQALRPSKFAERFVEFARFGIDQGQVAWALRKSGLSSKAYWCFLMAKG